MRKILIAVIVVTTVTGCGEGSRTEGPYMVVTNATHDCATGPNVSIESSSAEFALTSTCERILVKGGNNKLTIAAAKRIDVDGTRNVIEVNAADIIRVNGAGNTIKFKKKGVAKKTQDVAATGDNNSLIQLPD
jgi:hypothetical protein